MYNSLFQKFLLRHTKNTTWEYGSGEYTDQPPEELIVQSVRARLLDFLPQEIPYSLKCEIEFYSIHKGKLFSPEKNRNQRKIHRSQLQGT